MSEIDKSDLRLMADDLKESFRERCDHVEERLGDRIDGVNTRLDKLNSKTDKNITDIARIQQDLATVQAARTAEEPKPRRAGLTLTLTGGTGLGVVLTKLWEIVTK